MGSPLVGLGVILVVGGCGGGTGLGPMTIDELPARYQAAECRVLVMCGEFPDRASCEQTFPLAEIAIPAVDAVKRGTMTFDGTAASECLSQIGADCSNPDPPACDQLFQGHVAAGGTCTMTGECVGGGQCGKPVGCMDACCAGTCGPARIALGGDCSGGTSECVKGSHCDGGTCAADLPAGASCANGVPCAEPAVCNYIADNPDSNTCVLPAASGAACDPTHYMACARSDEYCDTGKLTCTKKRPLGAACSAAIPCINYGDCQNGVCGARVGVGAACDDAAGGRCLSLLDCVDGVCTAVFTPAPSCGG